MLIFIFTSRILTFSQIELAIFNNKGSPDVKDVLRIFSRFYFEFVKDETFMIVIIDYDENLKAFRERAKRLV